MPLPLGWSEAVLTEWELQAQVPWILPRGVSVTGHRGGKL